MKKHLGLVVRLLIAAAGVGFILYTLNWTDRVVLPAGYVLPSGVEVAEDGAAFRVVDKTDRAYQIESGLTSAWIEKADLVAGGNGPRFEPAVTTAVRQADRPLLLGGLGVFAPVFLIGAARWMVLMRARGIDVTFGRCYRLTMAGQFFNLCMPGTTGGDVMKAYYAAKASDKRGDAVVSVAVDRLCGIVGLVLVVAVLGLFSLDDALMRRLTLGMWAGLIVGLLCAWLYAHKPLRNRLRLGRLIDRLPGSNLMRKIDGLIAAYRDHKAALAVAVLMSVPVHLGLALAMSLAGFALGVDRPLIVLLGTVPIILLLWSLPVSGPLGLGPLDIVAVQLIVGGSGTTAQQAVMMFVAYRLYAVAIGLAGSLTLLGRDAPKRAQPTESAAHRASAS